MMVIREDGAIDNLAQFNNAFGFAPFVWSPICKKYLGNEYEWGTGNINRLWPLAKDPRLPLHWRVALACTYDLAIISAATAKEVAGHLRQFSAETDPSNERINHLAEIANLLGKLPENCVGACFHGTSVGDDPWHTYNELTEDTVPYDLKTGKGHFFVLETVKL